MCSCRAKLSLQLEIYETLCSIQVHIQADPERLVIHVIQPLMQIYLKSNVKNNINIVNNVKIISREMEMRSLKSHWLHNWFINCRHHPANTKQIGETC